MLSMKAGMSRSRRILSTFRTTRRRDLLNISRIQGECTVWSAGGTGQRGISTYPPFSLFSLVKHQRVACRVCYLENA